MSATETTTDVAGVVEPDARPDLAPAPRSGWIDHWDPEDPSFWEATGKRTARRNLIFSILAEHLGFSVWLLWSVSAAMLAKAGFGFSAQQLFWLVAVPNLVGSLPPIFAIFSRAWSVAI